MVDVIGEVPGGDTQPNPEVRPDDTSPLAAILRYVSSVNSVIGRDRPSEPSSNTTGVVSE